MTADRPAQVRAKSPIGERVPCTKVAPRERVSEWQGSPTKSEMCLRNPTNGPGADARKAFFAKPRCHVSRLALAFGGLLCLPARTLAEPLRMRADAIAEAQAPAGLIVLSRGR